MPQIETGLRSAVASGAYDDARRLLSDYCREAERQLRSFPAGDPEAAELARQTQNLMHWINCMVRAARAHVAAQLQQLDAILPYQSPKGRTLQTWEVKG